MMTIVLGAMQGPTVLMWKCECLISQIARPPNSRFFSLSLSLLSALSFPSLSSLSLSPLFPHSFFLFSFFLQNMATFDHISNIWSLQAFPNYLVRELAEFRLVLHVEPLFTSLCPTYAASVAAPEWCTLSTCSILCFMYMKIINVVLL